MFFNQMDKRQSYMDDSAALVEEDTKHSLPRLSLQGSLASFPLVNPYDAENKESF
jgi:hypothetical protein